MKKIGKLAALIAAAALVATGCAKEAKSAGFSPDTSSVYVTRGGAVTGAVVEKLENDYYDEAGLKASVEEDLAGLNAASGSGGEAAVSVKECSIKDGVAKLLIDFKDGETYGLYMEQFGDEDGTNRITGLSVTDTAGALANGDLEDTVFHKASGDSKEIAVSDIAKEKLYVAVTEGPGLLQTEGKIRYVSENVTVTGDTTAQTPDEGKAVIVFQ